MWRIIVCCCSRCGWSSFCVQFLLPLLALRSCQAESPHLLKASDSALLRIFRRPNGKCTSIPSPCVCLSGVLVSQEPTIHVACAEVGGGGGGRGTDNTVFFVWFFFHFFSSQRISQRAVRTSFESSRRGSPYQNF